MQVDMTIIELSIYMYMCAFNHLYQRGHKELISAQFGIIDNVLLHRAKRPFGNINYTNRLAEKKWLCTYQENHIQRATK